MVEPVHIKVTLPQGAFGPEGAAKLRAAEVETVSEVVSMVQYFARAKAPRHTGISINSLQRSVDPYGTSVTGKVFSPLPHMVVLEYGRMAPGRFPPDDKDADASDVTARPIAAWLIQKGIASESDNDFEARVFLIRRAIALHGFKGHPYPQGFHFLRTGVDEARPRIQDVWAEASRRQFGAA